MEELTRRGRGVFEPDVPLPKGVIVLPLSRKTRSISLLHSENRINMSIDVSTDDYLPLKSIVVVIDDNEEKNESDSAKTKDFFLFARSKRWKAMIDSSMRPHPGASPNLVLWLYGLLSSGYIPLFSVGILFYLEKLHVDATWAKAAVRASKLQQPMKSWEDFASDQMSKRVFPLATSTVIVLCVLLHVCRVILWGDHWRPSEEADPVFNLLARTYHGNVDENTGFYRFFTTIFLQSSNTQLGCSVFRLWIYGTKMEQMHGPLFIVCMLFLTGVASITSSVLIGRGVCGINEFLFCIRGAMYMDVVRKRSIIQLQIGEERACAKNSIFKIYCAPILAIFDFASLLLDVGISTRSIEDAYVYDLVVFFGMTFSGPFTRVSYQGIKLPLGNQQDLLDKKAEHEMWNLCITVSLLLFCILSYSASHEWRPPALLPPSFYTLEG